MIRLLKRFKNSLDFFKRVCTGRFWIPVGKIPENGRPLFVPGDPSAIPRTSPYWRDQWKWIVLYAPHSAPFVVYFESEAEGFCMRYWREIRTPYVAMRVGPSDIKVIAISSIGHGNDVMELDVFMSPDTEEEIRNKLVSMYLTNKVTWI